MTPNLLALLQAAQMAQSHRSPGSSPDLSLAPRLGGPIAPQRPTPAFHTPPTGFAPAPALPRPPTFDPAQFVKNVGGLAGAMQRLGVQPGDATAAVATGPVDGDSDAGFFGRLLRSLGLDGFASR
jgi:hypothetical protein